MRFETTISLLFACSVIATIPPIHRIPAPKMRPGVSLEDCIYKLCKETLQEAGLDFTPGFKKYCKVYCEEYKRLEALSQRTSSQGTSKTKS